ncbi:Fic family protein [Hoeflea poritis]|uniref:Fic family protein n=1 Tax=Hoeflea poritis TaxID=2993659 RepID=A0ABT4VVM5_9HYPH|nr:Fic family protein [Hoeflea poritis]MDA4848777.1 Fic family protein [Hoeflea poritis]
MEMSIQNRFSGPVTVFHERRLPERGIPAGYAVLIDAYDLHVPLPRTLSAIGERHRIIEEGGWRLYTPRHAPEATLEDQLTFALKNEGLDLIVLKRLFQATGVGPIEEIVNATPTGSYARRIWFLYEWLTGERLDLPDAERGAYVEIVDPKQQYAGQNETSSRHRVKNNLPGTPDFCPLVFRTETLERFIALGLQARAQEVVAAVPRDLLARTAAFLLLKDSKSSFAIEGESPPQDRIQRWGRAIGEAGKRPIDLDELLRLQRIVIGDARFVHMGLRTEGGFVGEHDRDTRMPIPDHISARHEDLNALIAGLAAFDAKTVRQLDPVIAAAVLAFGFVFIHPFEDGNGRLHRYLIHHVLTEHQFNPTGVVFPVSAAILERIDDYRRVLEDYSAQVLPLVEWQPTENGNVRVLNDTGDFYRFFDATPQAEFLFECVQKTIEQDLPEEAEFLRRYDAFRSRLGMVVDMPDRLSDLLYRFLSQNGGKLSQRGREREFSALTGEEVKRIEGIYDEIF